MVKDLEDLELVANKVQDELKTYVYANRKEEFEVKDFLEVYNSDTSKKSEEFIEKSKERHPEREDFEFIRDVLFPLVSDVEEMKELKDFDFDIGMRAIGSVNEGVIQDDLEIISFDIITK